MIKLESFCNRAKVARIMIKKNKKNKYLLLFAVIIICIFIGYNKYTEFRRHAFNEKMYDNRVVSLKNLLEKEFNLITQVVMPYREQESLRQKNCKTRFYSLCFVFKINNDDYDTDALSSAQEMLLNPCDNFEKHKMKQSLVDFGCLSKSIKIDDYWRSRIFHETTAVFILSDKKTDSKRILIKQGARNDL